MSPTLALAGLAAVTLIDVVGSIASKRFGFAYPKLAPVSFAVYFLVGFGGERMGASMPTIAGAVVAIYDVTIGWWLSWVIGPGRLPANLATPSEIMQRMVIVALLDVGLVTVGMWLARSTLLGTA